jgi:hypothetical protein
MLLASLSFLKISPLLASLLLLAFLVLLTLLWLFFLLLLAFLELLALPLLHGIPAFAIAFAMASVSADPCGVSRTVL